MIKIRLARVGRHKEPIYRIVCADHKYARDGRYISWLGQYNPAKGIASAELNEEETIKCLNNGAQYSGTVKAILEAKGLIKKAKEAKPEVKKEGKIAKTASPKANKGE